MLDVFFRRQKAHAFFERSEWPLSSPRETFRRKVSARPRARRAHPRARVRRVAGTTHLARDYRRASRRHPIRSRRDGLPRLARRRAGRLLAAHPRKCIASTGGDPRSKRVRARCRPRRAPRWRTTRRTSRPRRKPHSPRPNPRRRRSTSALARGRRDDPRASPLGRVSADRRTPPVFSVVRLDRAEPRR